MNNKKTIFAVSDIHSFFSIFLATLKKSGFDTDNPNHILVVCGDLFDRGREPLELINFLLSLPEDRLVLLRGNHEDLLLQMLQRRSCWGKDIKNGTLQTLLDLNNLPSSTDLNENHFNNAYRILRPLYLRMRDIFETDHYIFVHSWIPVFRLSNKSLEYTGEIEFNSNWRNAPAENWEFARWINPFDMVQKGLLPEKTLIFGHWNASYAWRLKKGTPEYGPESINDIYYGDGYIAIDGNTTLSGKVNILVLEDYIE